MVVVVDPAPAQRIDARRRMPQRAARVPVFATGDRGGPLVGAVADQPMVRPAGQGEVVDVRAAAVLPFSDVMGLGEQCGSGAAGLGAAEISGDQSYGLYCYGDAYMD